MWLVGPFCNRKKTGFSHLQSPVVGWVFIFTPHSTANQYWCGFVWNTTHRHRFLSCNLCVPAFALEKKKNKEQSLQAGLDLEPTTIHNEQKRDKDTGYGWFCTNHTHTLNLTSCGFFVCGEGVSSKTPNRKTLGMDGSGPTRTQSEPSWVFPSCFSLLRLGYALTPERKNTTKLWVWMGLDPSEEPNHWTLSGMLSDFLHVAVQIKWFTKAAYCAACGNRTTHGHLSSKKILHAIWHHIWWKGTEIYSSSREIPNWLIPKPCIIQKQKLQEKVLSVSTKQKDLKDLKSTQFQGINQKKAQMGIKRGPLHPKGQRKFTKFLLVIE